MARLAGRRARPRRRDVPRARPDPGRRHGAAVRQARALDGLVAGDPTARRARGRRLLDERGRDRDARGAATTRRARRRAGRLRARAVLPARRLAGDARAGRFAHPLARRRGRCSARRDGAAGGRGRDPARRQGEPRDFVRADARGRQRAALRPVADRHGPPGKRRRPRAARADAVAPWHRGRRAHARRGERLGARRRDRHRAVHARRQVPRTHRRLRPDRPRGPRGPSRGAGHDLHRPAGGDGRRHRGRSQLDVGPRLGAAPLDLRAAEARRASSRSSPTPSGVC